MKTKNLVSFALAIILTVIMTGCKETVREYGETLVTEGIFQKANYKPKKTSTEISYHYDFFEGKFVLGPVTKTTPEECLTTFILKDTGKELSVSDKKFYDKFKNFPVGASVSISYRSIFLSTYNGRKLVSKKDIDFEVLAIEPNKAEME